ncbi:MAG: sulfoxide reductase heme-binding subunit YedZ [Gammaproteobacteria bacterium]|nr:sulfoxide reductase heme-binding subunit YedZ [Gammaproteobacteria bacterium]
MRTARRWRHYLKPLVFALCLAPALWLAAGVRWPAWVDLGANPVEKIQHTLGLWALRLLLATLAITPLRQLTGQVEWLAYRRMLGLFAFFHVAAHLLFYVVVDQQFAWPILLEDVAERPFITVGFAAFLLLLPLAATSTAAAQRRLGRRWLALHRLIYPAALLGCVHFWWQVKADIREPAAYAAVAAILLGWRLYRRRPRPAVTGAAPTPARGSSRD